MQYAAYHNPYFHAELLFLMTILPGHEQVALAVQGCVFLCPESVGFLASKTRNIVLSQRNFATEDSQVYPFFSDHPKMNISPLSLDTPNSIEIQNINQLITFNQLLKLNAQFVKFTGPEDFTQLAETALAFFFCEKLWKSTHQTYMYITSP